MAGINNTDEREYAPKLTFKNNSVLGNVSICDKQTTEVKKYYCTDEWDCRCDRVNGCVQSDCIQAEQVKTS